MAADQQDPDKMDISMTSNATTPTTTATSAAAQKKESKSLELASCTIRAPAHSYMHLQLLADNDSNAHGRGDNDLDAIQVKAYCSSALKQFLGLHGSAIPFDVLKVDGRHCWLRTPRDDLAAFAAAVTAWQGTSSSSSNGGRLNLRLVGCSDWLGTLIGRDGEDKIWSG